MKFRFKQPRSQIKIFDFLHRANKKESKILNFSLNFISRDKNKIFNSYNDNLSWDFYYIELLVELFNRFHNEMGITSKSNQYFNTAFEELSIAFRFMMIGYYRSSHLHLRLFLENVINFVYESMNDKKLLQKYNQGNNTKLKIEQCFTAGQFSRINKNRKDEDMYDEQYFSPEVFYKNYIYLSNNFVHTGSQKWQDLEFNEENFNKNFIASTFAIIYVARFINISLGYDIEKYWRNEVLKPEPYSIHKMYGNYLQFLFGANKIASNQNSYIWNLIHDNEEKNKEFICDIMGLSLVSIISPGYIKSTKEHDELWEKSGKNREIYYDLMAEKNGWK